VSTHAEVTADALATIQVEVLTSRLWHPLSRNVMRRGPSGRVARKSGTKGTTSSR
jgi:hypothetical protein